jgi:hypothetical protein
VLRTDLLRSALVLRAKLLRAELLLEAPLRPVGQPVPEPQVELLPVELLRHRLRKLRWLRWWL